MNHTKTFILLAAMTALFAAIGYMAGGPGGMAVAFAIAVAMNAFSYWNADKIVLRMYKATPAETLRDHPVVRVYFDDTVALAKRAGMPVPKIYIIDNPQPNAFATGRDPENAAVAATTGLLQILDRDEVRGVMAHELAHVKNRDTLTMTVTATIAGAIGMLANFAMFFSPRDGNGNPNPIAGILIMILAPIAAAIVQMAISRSREYEADRVGAEIAGDPGALARALDKIERYARGVLNVQAESNPATAHMFIINPLAGRGADNLFSTHPATQNRIDRLLAMGGIAREAFARAEAPAGADRPAGGPWGGGRARGPWG